MKLLHCKTHLISYTLQLEIVSKLTEAPKLNTDQFLLSQN